MTRTRASDRALLALTAVARLSAAAVARGGERNVDGIHTCSSVASGAAHRRDILLCVTPEVGTEI